jgi:hypothetical protein
MCWAQLPPSPATGSQLQWTGQNLEKAPKAASRSSITDDLNEHFLFREIRALRTQTAAMSSSSEAALIARHRLREERAPAKRVLQIQASRQRIDSICFFGLNSPA